MIIQHLRRKERRMKRFGAISGCIACILWLLAQPLAAWAEADLSLPALFGDHMVLQRHRAVEYRDLLTLLIRDWRGQWGQGDFPFLIQQLVNNGPPPKDANTPGAWPRLRESQAEVAATVPACGLAVGIDLGSSNDPMIESRSDGNDVARGMFRAGTNGCGGGFCRGKIISRVGDRPRSLPLQVACGRGNACLLHR